MHCNKIKSSSFIYACDSILLDSTVHSLLTSQQTAHQQRICLILIPQGSLENQGKKEAKHLGNYDNCKRQDITSTAA